MNKLAISIGAGIGLGIMIMYFALKIQGDTTIHGPNSNIERSKIYLDNKTSHCHTFEPQVTFCPI